MPVSAAVGWNRAALRFTGLHGADPYGWQPFTRVLSEAVVPVVVLGEARDDLERGTFQASAASPVPPPAESAWATFAATDRDCIIERAWAVTSFVFPQQILMACPAPAGLTATGPILSVFSTLRSSPSAVLTHGSDVVDPTIALFATRVTAPGTSQDVTMLENVLIPAGQSVYFTGATLGASWRWFFQWRELGGLFTP